MNDSMLDMIYIIGFALLMFLINMRKRKREQKSQVNQSLEKTVEAVPENIGESRNLREKISTLENAGSVKSIFGSSERQKELILEPVDAKIISLSHIPMPSESPLSGNLSQHVFPSDYTPPKEKKEKDQSSNRVSIADKASSKDMVILSAIYFPPYI